MFNIDFSHLVRSTLPKKRRTPFWVALQRWWLSIIALKFDGWLKQELQMLELARTTGQIGAIVELLQSYYPNAGDFFITQAPLTDSIYVFGDAETNDPDVWLYGDIELESTAVLYGDNELNLIQFIVSIPAGLNNPDDIAIITQLVQQTCLAGMAFEIQIQG